MAHEFRVNVLNLSGTKVTAANVLTTGQTNLYYPANNPSGFITAAAAGGVSSILVTGQNLSGIVGMVGAGGTQVRISGTSIVISGGAAVGGAAQSPWTGNIEANSYSLMNALDISSESAHITEGFFATLLSTDITSGIDMIRQALVRHDDGLITVDWSGRNLSGAWNAESIKMGANTYSDSGVLLAGATSRLQLVAGSTSTTQSMVYVRAGNGPGYIQLKTAGGEGLFVNDAGVGIQGTLTVTGGIVGTGQFITTDKTGQFITTAQTGILASTGWVNQYYYPRSNPSGYGMGGGSQTPWTGNIEANSYSLMNALDINAESVHITEGYVNVLLSMDLTSGIDMVRQALVRHDNGLITVDWSGRQLSGTWNAQGLNVNSSAVVTSSQTGQFAPSGMTGQFVTTAQTGHIHSQYALVAGTGQFISTAQTGQFAPSGMTGQFVTTAQTGHIHSQYALVAGTGQFISTAQTGQFAPSGMTGQFVTTAQTGHIHSQYALVAGTGQFISTAQTGQFAPSGMTGQFISTAQTGRFAGYTSTVWTTGDQDIAGAKKFQTNLEVTGTIYTAFISEYSIQAASNGNSIDLTAATLIEDNAGPVLFWGSRTLTGTWNTEGLTFNGVTTGQAFYPRFGNPAGYLTSASLGGVNSINVTGQLLSGDIIITGIGGTVVDISGTAIRISGGAGGPGGNYVTLDTPQTITSEKIFNAEVRISGASVDLDIYTSGNDHCIVASGHIDSFYEAKVMNLNTGFNASADFVVANSTDPNNDYVDMGVNSDNYSGAMVGYTGDGYVYHIGRNFYIGNVTPNQRMFFFAGHNMTGNDQAQSNVAEMTVTDTGVGFHTGNPRFAIDVMGTGNFTQGLFCSGRPVVLGPITKVKTAAWTNPEGIYSGTYSVAVWRCAGDTQLTGIHGIRYGGSGCFLQAYKNSQALPLLTTPSLFVGSTGVWVTSGNVQNTIFNAGDTLIMSILSISGLPTSVSMQADFLD